MDPFADESFLTQNNRPGTGWSRLGRAFGGNSDAAFQMGAVKGAQLETALLAARKARDAEVGRQAMAKAAADAGDTELANAFLQGAGDNLSQLGSYHLDRQRQGMIDAANTLAGDPNASLDSLNRRMIVIGGKPVDLTKIEDHTALNPMVSPAAQTSMAPNELGQALIGANNALATQRMASAGASNALRDKRTGLDDATMQDLMAQATAMANIGGPGANQDAADAWLEQKMAEHGAQLGDNFAGEKPTSLTGPQIKAMFGAGAGEIDSAGYRRFLDFQRARGIPNAQRAAQLFSTDMSNVQGGASVPTVPQAPAPGVMDRITSALHGVVHGNAPAHPASRAEFDALPKGAMFVNPADGRLLRKK